MRAIVQNWRRVILVFFFLWSSCSYVYSQEDQDSDYVKSIETYIVGDGITLSYQLEDDHILEGTEKVKKAKPDGETDVGLKKDEDYLFDYNKGILTFFLPLPPKDSVSVTYQRLNFDLRRKYYHRELVYLEDAHGSTEQDLPREVSSSGFSGGSISQNRKSSFLPPKSSSDLTFTGSKTFSLEVGSAQDLSLKQGLWLSANGRLSQNLKISLQVSDQNMPTTSEGASKRLEELDKVQIIVTSPHFSGTFGDFYLESSASELFFYEKKLKGIMTEAKVGVSSFSFALASSKGESFTNRFLGEDDKQGPYYLKGKNGEKNVMILPGTERVWVDGEECQGGSDNDYSIDYSRGAIQFTPRKLITSDSRITVDFEYSVENYQRDLYSGNLGTRFWDGKVEIKAGGIMEKDNQNHPSSFNWSSEDKQILSQAGNDRVSASKDGALFVGAEKGDYDLAYDSSGNPYYQYSGHDSGSYDASFSWVGEKKGSYQYKGGGIYQYVYPNQGDFLPIVLLPLPESHFLFDLNFSFSPVSTFETQVEWAKSKKDKNTFSSKDDEHNWGDAVFLKSAYQNADFEFLKANFRRLELKGEYRLVQQDFAPFGRMDLADKERKWDSPQNAAPVDEKTYLLTGMVSPSAFLSLDFDWGKLNQVGDFSSQRRSLGIEIFPTNWLSTKGKTEKIKSHQITDEKVAKQSEWTRNSVVISNKIRKLSTSFSWEQEKRNSLSADSTGAGDRFDQLGGKIRLDWSNRIKTSTELFYREDDTFKESWLDQSFSYTWRNLLSVRDYQEMLSSDFEFSRRIKRFQNSLGADQKENLLVARMDFYPLNQLINLKLYHSQNQIHSEGRMDTYVEVEEGKGDFNYEDGEYFPHFEGNFIRLSEWLGETQSSLDLSKSIRLIFSPYKVTSRRGENSFWSQVGKIFSTDSFLNLKGRFKDERSPGFYLVYPLIKLSDKNILSQNVMVRQDLYLLPACRPLNLQLRWEESQDQNQLVSSGGRQEKRSKQELIFKSYISSTSLFESRCLKEKIKNDWGGVPKNFIKGKGLKIGFTRQRLQVFELKIFSEFKNREDQIQKVKVEFFSVAPGFSWSILSGGKLNADLGWTHLQSTPQNKNLSYILTEGKRRGENYSWSFSLDYKLSQYLSSAVIYSGESAFDEKIKHTGRMEMKAYF